jgi:phosphoglycolate phosphatase
MVGSDVQEWKEMVTIRIPGHRFTDIDLVIFDKDGTLIDLYRYWSEMSFLRASLIKNHFKLTTEQMVNTMYAMGVDRKNSRILPNGPVGIKKREEVMQAAIEYLKSIGHTNHDINETCHEIFEEVDRMSLAYLDRIVVPILGARYLIDSLSKQGCKIAIATTDRSYRAELAMKVLKFDEKIDLIIGTDMVTDTKPHPEMIQYILKELDVCSERALMVGDAITDLEMGNRAHLAGSIGVMTGLTGRVTLEKITPYIIRSVAEMSVYGGDRK